MPNNQFNLITSRTINENRLIFLHVCAKFEGNWEYIIIQCSATIFNNTSYKYFVLRYVQDENIKY